MILTKTFLVLAYTQFPHLETLKLQHTCIEPVGTATPQVDLFGLFDERERQPMEIKDTGGPCNTLTDLDITGCTLINSSALIDLIAFRCPNLERLVINDLPALGELTILRMMEICIRLKTLSVTGCKLNDFALAAIRQKGGDGFLLKTGTFSS